MKRVWIDHYYLSDEDPLTQSVADFLDKNDFNVELFNVSSYAEELPMHDFFQIVDYGSRELIYDGMNDGG